MTTHEILIVETMLRMARIPYDCSYVLAYLENNYGHSAVAPDGEIGVLVDDKDAINLIHKVFKLKQVLTEIEKN